jgi:hypothetical protein
VYSDAIGSSVVIANSLVIAEILRSPAPVGTAIAVMPGQAAVGHSSEPDDVVVFTLDPEGPRVAHERSGASGASGTSVCGDAMKGADHVGA